MLEVHRPLYADRQPDCLFTIQEEVIVVCCDWLKGPAHQTFTPIAGQQSEQSRVTGDCLLPEVPDEEKLAGSRVLNKTETEG